MCVLKMAEVDTKPGVNPEDPFCPPTGFSGSVDDYLQMCRVRYETDVMFGQRMLVIARYASKPRSAVVTPFKVRGPFAKQAQYVIESLQLRMKNQATSVA